MRLLRRLPSPALIISSFALLVALGGSAYAVQQLDGKLIKDRSIAGSKLMRDTLTGAEIRESTLFDCPAGTRLFTGVCVETALRGGNRTWDDSATVCKALARRLPTVAELWLFRNQPDITLGGTAGQSEWALDVVDAGHHVAVNDAGDNALTASETLLPYRCVAAPKS